MFHYSPSSLPMISILSQGPALNEAYDANTASAHAYLNSVKEWLTQNGRSIQDADLEAREHGNEALSFRTMLKFIESEQVINELKEPVWLTLINPVYKETGRLQRREEHPHGENSLRTKIECIRYFEGLNSNFHGRVFVVDDECPEGSGKIAEAILEEYPDSPHKVFYLGKAIDDKDPDIPPGITHKNGSNRSVKGGASLYGMRKALSIKVEGSHIVVDNDADLSVHPMQLGLLLKDIVNGEARAVAGSRREEDSIALIGGSRDSRGSLFIKIWQHFLPQLAQRITDTNRAFKAFESRALEQILPLIKIYTFPYQIELLQACISNDILLVKKGIAYLDSEAASTQDGENITETYLNQIHQIIDIARRYKTLPESDRIMQFFLSISEKKWRQIEANPPEMLEDLIS